MTALRDSFARLAEAIEERNRLDRPGKRPPGYKSDFKQIGGATYVFAVPGLWRAFKPVPDTHVDGDEVCCVCEARTRVEFDRLIECSGGCGRSFIGTRGGPLACGPFPDASEGDS